MAYKALIRPKLEYGAVAWNPHSNLHIDKLEQVQRSAARFVTGDHRRTSSVTDMITNLQWPSLEQRRLKSQLIMFYKIVHKVVKIDMPESIVSKRVSTRRGNQYSYIQPSCRTYIYSYSFFPRVTRAWNTLPVSTVTAPDIASFKAALDGQVLIAPVFLTRL